MIRVLICDDQTVVREGLAAILSTDDEIEIVGLARNGEEALALAATDRPDVVLMDLNMPVMNGVQATQRLRRSYPVQIFCLHLAHMLPCRKPNLILCLVKFRIHFSGFITGEPILLPLVLYRLNSCRKFRKTR